jgi:AcrR family transcriptional regulator
LKTVQNGKNQSAAAKEPVQERSMNTRTRIINAAKDLFAELGYEDTTTTLIAKRAKVSIGGLYGRFDNKWEIFLIILQEHSKATYNFLRKGVDRMIDNQTDIRDLLKTLIPELFTAYKLSGRLNAEISRLILINDEARKMNRYWENKEDEELSRLLRHYRPDADLDDIKIMTTILHRLTHELFNYMYECYPELDEERYLKHYIKLIDGYFLNR